MMSNQYLKAIHGAGAKACEFKRDRLWLFYNIQGNEIFIIFTSVLWYRRPRRSAALSSKQSVSKLGSLSLLLL